MVPQGRFERPLTRSERGLLPLEDRGSIPSLPPLASCVPCLTAGFAATAMAFVSTDCAMLGFMFQLVVYLAANLTFVQLGLQD